MKMAEETIYLCNFRVSVDGDWLCLRELSDVQLQMEPEPMIIDEGEFQPAVLPPGGFSQHAARACALGAGRWASTPRPRCRHGRSVWIAVRPSQLLDGSAR